MAAVDPGYAAWLKSSNRTVGATIAGSSVWGAGAVDSAVASALALKADAQTEATAQAQFLAGPLARDRIVVPGLQRGLIGRVVTITGDRLGYEAGADVFVIGVQEADGPAMSTLIVLKRL